jgi:hypothetical protein
MNNYIVIGLGILILILIYVFYIMFASTKYIVLKQISLNDTQPAIMKSAIKNPASTNFAYGFWIYVNSWSNNSGKTIMYLQETDSNIASAIETTSIPSGKKIPFFSIGLDKTKLDLYCTTSKIDSAITDNKKTKITSNFPIQKWTYVVVSVDGEILDCYLDGKLVISKQIDNYTDFITKLKDCNIYLGDCDSSNKNDFYITKFNRWDHALDPKTVWNNYLNGNGTSSYSSNYNINLAVKKNGEIYKDFSVY